MAFTLDPQVAAALAAQAEHAATSGVEVPARGDAHGLRALAEGTIATMLSKADPAPDVTCTSHTAIAEDGTHIELRWYTKAGATPGSAIVYVHGGGMIMDSVEDYDPLVRQYVQWTGVPQLAVEYRLAPEVKGETPARDVLAAVRWVHQNAEQLAVDPYRLAIMGDSGGGGIGAGAVILARDNGIALAKQILLYPMLDDRTIDPDPDLVPHASWNYDANYTGWYALLGEEIGTDAVSPVAAPARLDCPGLPLALVTLATQTPTPRPHQPLPAPGQRSSSTTGDTGSPLHHRNHASGFTLRSQVGRRPR